MNSRTDADNELRYIAKEMRRMAREWLTLTERAQAMELSMTDLATEFEKAGLNHQCNAYAGLANEAKKLQEQLVTMPAWAQNDQPDDSEEVKYRITQMIKDGRTFWVVVNSTDERPWPVYSSPYRHHAVEEMNRLNSRKPAIATSMYAKRRAAQN